MLINKWYQAQSKSRSAAHCSTLPPGKLNCLIPEQMSNGLCLLWKFLVDSHNRFHVLFIVAWQQTSLGPVHTGDKVERTFDIRATKITDFRQSRPSSTCSILATMSTATNRWHKVTKRRRLTPGWRNNLTYRGLVIIIVKDSLRLNFMRTGKLTMVAIKL